MHHQMEVSWVQVMLIISILWGAWKVLKKMWLKPKKLETYLRLQGFTGNSYRLFFGDMKDLKRCHAKSKPAMDLSDDIASKVDPFNHQTIESYGKNSFIWWGTTPRVNIMDPEQIKEILTNNSNFKKQKLNPLLKLLTTGLSTIDGKKWVKHRKIINQAFHLDKLKIMLPAFSESCSDMTSKWESLCLDGSCELDIWPYLHNLTGDVISRTAFGSNYEEGKIIFDLHKEMANYASQVLSSLYIPGWRLVPTKMNKRMKDIDKEIRRVIKDIIQKREKAMEAGENDTYNDLLGILMQTKIQDPQESASSNRNMGMSTEDIVEECKLFYFAGQVTTSILLVWTMVLLSRYPNWQSRAREEVARVFGGEKPDYDSLNQLKIVTMILHEALRLYPPIPIIHRKVTTEMKIKNLTLPEGVVVTLPPLFVHHDREFWGEDANEFKPERFSDGVSKATKGQVSYFPFGWGPRLCVGQNFAMIEAKIALSLILQRFSFELSSTYVHAPTFVLLLVPKYGAHIVLHKV